MSTESVATRQHGVISRRQLLAAKTTRRQIDTRLKQGRLTAVHPGVYRVGGAPATDRQRLWAATLWAGDDAALSHRSAAELWSLEGVESELPELWSPRTLRSDTVISHRGSVDNRDRGRLHGLTVTSPARTLIDLAAVVGERLLEGAIEDARRRRLVTLERVRDDARRLARLGRPGTRMLRRVIDALEGQPPAESVLEVEVARILRSSGLPVPARQYEVVVNGRRYRVDFAWPARRVGLECEGYAWHGRRRAFDPDRARLAALVSTGWRIIPVTCDQTKTPDRLVRLVTNALAAAAS